MKLMLLVHRGMLKGIRAFSSFKLCYVSEINHDCSAGYDAWSGGEREIQRIMLELLNQLDDF